MCLSDPPTPKEQLLLAACRLMRKPVAIMPAKCRTVKEWVELCPKDRRGAKPPLSLSYLRTDSAAFSRSSLIRCCALSAESFSSDRSGTLAS